MFWAKSLDFKLASAQNEAEHESPSNPTRGLDTNVAIWPGGVVQYKFDKGVGKNKLRSLHLSGVNLHL